MLLLFWYDLKKLFKLMHLRRAWYIDGTFRRGSESKVTYYYRILRARRIVMDDLAAGPKACIEGSFLVTAYSK